jgi:hypothetical protein
MVSPSREIEVQYSGFFWHPRYTEGKSNENPKEKDLKDKETRKNITKSRKRVSRKSVQGTRIQIK